VRAHACESPEIAYLLGATRALAFDPPSRAAAASPIARYLADGPLTLLCDYRPRYAESSRRRLGRATSPGVPQSLFGWS
jgi:hypothetical protein